MSLEKKLGFKSSYNFIPERYSVAKELRRELIENGFEVGVHGLKHDGKLFRSKREFSKRAKKINRYLAEWEAVGFRSPSMQCNLTWLHDLEIKYDSSTFDTDPFEPQPQGCGSIFPFWIADAATEGGYWELPYTLPQDFLLFVLLREKTIDVWKKKMDWIVQRGGMVLLTTHPDYMAFNEDVSGMERFPAARYGEFLEYVARTYEDQYWNPLPRDLADYCTRTCDKRNASLRTKAPTKQQHKTYGRANKVWIDFENSPHVLYFDPIIEELEKCGCEVVLTAREFAQTIELLKLFRIEAKCIGHHYGGNRLLKVFGLLIRAAQLLPTAVVSRPDLALSHGSRSQMLAAKLLGIPIVSASDYEFGKSIPFMKIDLAITPDAIPAEQSLKHAKDVLRLPGIKEDVYVPGFKPDLSLDEQLGITNGEIIVTVRPPATTAHYHADMSDRLLEATLDYLMRQAQVKVFLLPRSIQQAETIQGEWSGQFASGQFIIPGETVHGLNLIWHSDLVISGGGTMIREAAALGVPSYSIFGGQIGAVDKYLASQNRLVLIHSIEDISTKIELKRRHRPKCVKQNHSNALERIVESVTQMVEA